MEFKYIILRSRGGNLIELKNLGRKKSSNSERAMLRTSSVKCPIGYLGILDDIS